LPLGKYKVGLYILVPDNSLRPASDPDRASLPDIWLDRPSPDGAIEIAIATWNINEVPEDWPGKAAGTQLIAVYGVSEVQAIGIFARALPAQHPITESVATMFEQMAPILPKKIILDSPERRGIVAGTTIHGSLCLVELAID